VPRVFGINGRWYWFQRCQRQVTLVSNARFKLAFRIH
jgi:hypothetical protein